MPNKIKVTVEFEIDMTEYSEDLTNADNARELVNDMLDREADFPKDFFNRKRIYLEYR